jgi:hypothetical protein
MKTTKTITLFLTTFTILGLQACATAPDPAKVCTAEWITPRTDKAINRIESKTRKAVKNLVKLGEAYADGKTPGMFTMMRFRSSIDTLKTELTEGRGITDIKMLAKTCDNPEIITKAVREVFEKQGVSERVLSLMDDLKIFQDIIEENLDDMETLETL